MRSKTVVLTTIAILSMSSTAMAGGHGGMGGHGMIGHHFNHHFPNFRNQFLKNQTLFAWGSGWGWGWPYDNGGNTTVVAFPQVVPRTADVTGSTSAPCRLTAETFTVPSSAGGTKPVQILGCR
jgi:hypothetical protein